MKTYLHTLSLFTILAFPVGIYAQNSASADVPQDVTSLIVNADFEQTWTGWTNVGMSLQSNDSFTAKSGNTYVEKWVSSGSKVGTASVLQEVKGLTAGTYTLTCAAQNIQQGSSVSQSGAWIVAGDNRTTIRQAGDYSVTFTQIESSVTLGFQATSATGNWIACDNFRLLYQGIDPQSLFTALQQSIDQKTPLLEQKMSDDCRTALQSAIEAARQCVAQSQPEGLTSIADALAQAAFDAQDNITAYGDLDAAIAAAQACYDADGVGAADFLSAIDAAIAVSEHTNSSCQELRAQQALLEQALFDYRLLNGTGNVPQVTTQGNYVAGCHEVFGRMAVKGIANINILEQGFVYSETNPEPTVYDQRTTNCLKHNGNIYRVPMNPGTLFYMRAYCISKTYAVGYGDVIRVSTLPQGKVTWSYDYGSDEAAQNDRIETALREASEWWTNYTSIVGFNIGGHWSPGTPTADCSYGGYCRIGTNMGQRCGTILHEMNHGVGCGTLEIWGGWVASPLRVSINGDWAGDRANRAIQFWENDTTVFITGAYDGAHWGIHHLDQPYEEGGGTTALWMNQYAINGAHLEPGAWAGPTNWNDTQILFIGNSIITQGFMEDGLVPVRFGNGGYCLPAYVFEHRDGEKYYLTSEDGSRGHNTSYLLENSEGRLRWKSVDVAYGAQSDSAAWYISFDASKQHYQFQNVATGHYITYSSGVLVAKEKTQPSYTENFHLMRRRAVDAAGADRGYWILYPENMKALQAGVAGLTSIADQDLWDKASKQRWCILTEQQAIEAQNLAPIEQVTIDEVDAQQGASYNVLGQPVDENYHGIVIVNGRKVMR